MKEEEAESCTINENNRQLIPLKEEKEETGEGF